MPALPDLQRAFFDSVFSRDQGTDVITRFIRGDRFAPESHLSIYRNNIYASLTEALKAVYPVVTRLTGDGFFDYAASEYIPRFPPTGGNLHDYGAELAEFLTGFEPAAGLAYLPDCARLEWAWHQAFHAAEHESMDLSTLVSIPPLHYGELRCTLHPSVQLLASDFPLLRIWQVNQPGYTGSECVELSEGGVKLLIARHDLTVKIEPLSAGAFALLNALTAQASLSQANQAALTAQPDFDLETCLKYHTQHGTLVAVHLPGEPDEN